MVDRRRLKIALYAHGAPMTAKLGAPPRPAPPASVPGRVYAAVVERIGRRPQWGRPAAAGAIILFVTLAIRLADRLPAILFGVATFRQDIRLLAVPFLAAIAGAAGGFGYRWLAPNNPEELLRTARAMD